MVTRMAIPAKTNYEKAKVRLFSSSTYPTWSRSRLSLPSSTFVFPLCLLRRSPTFTKRPSRSLVFSHPSGLLPLLSSPFLCCRPIHRPHPVTVDTPPPWWESRLRGSGGGGSRQGGGLRDRRPRDRRDRNRWKRGTASPDHDPMPVPALIAVGVRHSPSSLWVLVVRPGRVPSTLRRLLRPFSLGGRSVGRSRCKSRTRTYGLFPSGGGPR